MLVKIIKIREDGFNSEKYHLNKIFEVFESSKYPEHYLLIQGRGEEEVGEKFRVPGVFGCLFEGPIPMLLKVDVEKVL